MCETARQEQNPNRLIQLLQFTDVWSRYAEIIKNSLQVRSAELSQALASPPSLFVVPDEQMTMAHSEIERMLGHPLADAPEEQYVEAFVQRLQGGPVLVTKQSLFDQFCQGQKWAIGTLAHEFGHIEEHYRYGSYPPNVCDWNCRTLWAEFFAEHIAAVFYNSNQFETKLDGLRRMIQQRSDILHIINHLGRITGFAFGKNMNQAEFCRRLAVVEPTFVDMCLRLWTLFSQALVNNEQPDPQQTYGVLCDTILPD